MRLLLNFSPPVWCQTADLINDAGLGGFLNRLTNPSRESSTRKPTNESDTPAQIAPAIPITEPTVKPDEPLTPIQFEQYAKEYQQLSGQDSFDGFRLEAGKAVTPQMQTSHTLFLGTSLKESGFMYQMGPTFALEDGTLFFMGRYGNDGTMTARGVKKLSKFSEMRVSASSSLELDQRNMFEVALDKNGSDWAAGWKAAWQGTWILNSTFSQVIAPNLHMGGDITWVAANSATTGSVGLRLARGRNIFSGILSRQPNFKSPVGLTENVHTGKFQYFRKVSERLSLGTELEISQEPPTADSSLKFGYEYLFRQARVQGLIDFGGRVSMTAQNAAGFGISGMIDYWRGDYKFGFMMQVIPPPEEPVS